jgi:hypothetical protein
VTEIVWGLSFCAGWAGAAGEAQADSAAKPSRPDITRDTTLIVRFMIFSLFSSPIAPGFREG